MKMFLPIVSIISLSIVTVTVCCFFVFFCLFFWTLSEAVAVLFAAVLAAFLFEAAAAVLDEFFLEAVEAALGAFFFDAAGLGTFLFEPDAAVMDTLFCGVEVLCSFTKGTSTVRIATIAPFSGTL